MSKKTAPGKRTGAKRARKVVCFFMSAQRFETRYTTLGIMYEARIGALVTKAVS